MIRQKPEQNSDGFTLTEVIAAMTVVAVLAAIMVPSCVGFAEEAWKQKYLIEAERVKESVNLYLLERYPEVESDPVGLLERVSEYDLGSSESPLTGYLLVNCTDGAYIRDLTLDSTGAAVNELIYMVGGYQIELAGSSRKIQKVQQIRKKGAEDNGTNCDTMGMDDGASFVH